jgi:transcriptional regulator with XRE-family HTH domain
MDAKTNFDRYLERRLEDDVFRAQYEAADRAWDVALQLAALRHERGLSQKQVAELLGTKQQAIARLENPAYTGHSLSMVRKYVEALGASLDVTIVPDEATGAYGARRPPKPLLALAESTESYNFKVEETIDK